MRMFVCSRLLAPAAVVLLASPVAFAQYDAAAVRALNGEDAAIVVKQPFTLVEKTLDEVPKADGTTVTRRTELHKWRDSQGRFRQEIAQTTEGKEAAPDRATITDPVKNTVTTIYFDRKTARVIHLPPGALHPYVDLDDRPMAAMPGVQIKTAKLGDKSIAGERAVGRSVTRTRPPGTIGNATTIISVSERWISPDLKITLATSMDDPREKQTREVTELTRGEPDATLFQIPADYAVTEAVGPPLQQEFISRTPH
jgi:hypothetical protein